MAAPLMPFQVNNAGCMIHEQRIDADGIEYNFATNVLAPHILTRSLTPLLLKYVEVSESMLL